jgi:S-(hydroxymethyl)glutathione dehydrogenase/alcohol dehydrogenase
MNQFLNLSSFAEQMLVHENAIVKIRRTCRWSWRL